MMITQG